MEKKEKEKNQGTYFILIGLVILCLVACFWTYKSTQKTEEKPKAKNNLETEVKKLASEVVESRSWLTGENSPDEFIYILTLRDLKEKYAADITSLEDAKCNLDTTYVEVTAKAGKTSYIVALNCK